MGKDKLQRRPADSDLSEMLSIIEEDGGLVVEGLFPTDVIAQMRDALDERAKSVIPGDANQGLGEDGKAFVGANTTRFSSLGKLSPAYFKMLDNEVYKALADAVLLPHCGSYWVNTGQAMLIGPNSPAQGLHRDCGNWLTMSAAYWPKGPELTLSAMIALEEVTEELGATRVIPGSHKWESLADNGTLEQSVPAEMQPGDALVYSGKVVHGGGANQTKDKWRKAMHLSYVVGWLTPEESSPLDYTDEELADQSPHVQRVLGHRSYDPRPHIGGGLWLRDVKKIEEVLELD